MNRKKEKGPAAIITSFETNNTGAPRTAKEIFDYADALRRVGRRRDALRWYDSLSLEDVPKRHQWLVPLYRGVLWMDQGEFTRAEGLFREALAADDTSTVPWIHLAGALAMQERFEEAVGVLRQAREKEGDRDEVYLNLGLNLRALGKLKDAEKALKYALELDPSYVEAAEAIDDVIEAVRIQDEGPRGSDGMC